MRLDEAFDTLRPAQQLRFGAFLFDARTDTLCHQRGDGWAPVTIGSRALAILHVLLRDPGVLVLKDTLLEAVWPGVTVETNNLTVQVAALRKILDIDRSGDSCIQTVAGRGYRFAADVVAVAAPLRPTPAEPAQLEPSSLVPARPPAKHRYTRRQRVVVAACTFVLLGALTIAGHAVWHKPEAKPLSLAILPFDDTPADHTLAITLTDNLAIDLSIVSGARVAPRDLTKRYVGSSLSATSIGRTLGVHYVLTGSLRRTGIVARVNAELISTETGGVLWTDGFAFTADSTGEGLATAEYRLSNLMANLVDDEVARAQRERPNKPTAMDLVLKTRQLLNGLPNPSRQRLARSLMEQALRLDPKSGPIKTRLAVVLLDDIDLNGGGRKDALERTRSLLATEPGGQQFSAAYQFAHLQWLFAQDDRCRETVEAAKVYGEAYPRLPAPLRWLSYCETQLGLADQAVTQLQQAIALQPLSGYQAANYRNLAYALLMLGHYEDSIVWARRALAANPEFQGPMRSRLLRMIAAASALLGRFEEARQELASANGIWPYATLRWVAPYQSSSPVHDSGLAKMQEGLRLAGLRDHADEIADFGTSSDTGLVQIMPGHTPVSAPGVKTIVTADLVRLLSEQRPIVIDTVLMEQGWSLPSAIGLRYVGEGGNLSDEAQARLATRMQALSQGDHSRSIVAVGWSAERYDGRNLALRLAALGYTHVYWYRGGREAWAVNGLPQAPLNEQDW